MGCNCDLDSPCSYPPCVQAREREAAYYEALYRAARPAAGLGSFAEQMRDAGRGHLLREGDL